MAKKRDKFGSPFDPLNWGRGKIEQPKKMGGKEEKPPEPMQLGPGCGNPQCPACYPDNVNRAARAQGMGFNNGMAVPGGPNRPGNIEYRRVAQSDGSFRDVPIRPGDPDPAARNREISESQERMLRDIARTMGMNPESLFGIIGSGRLSDMVGQRFLYNPMDGSMRPAGIEVPREPTAPPKREPPQSYKEAREEVEDFIVKADPQNFEDIVGNEEALEALIDAVQAPVKYKELYEKYNMKMPKGALLCGPPGCGKTMFARAAANEFIKLYGGEVEFLSIQSTDIQSMFVGATEAHIRNIFTFAREYKEYHGHPLLVFIDEAEVLFPDRTGRVRRVTPWEESQVSTFLAEMDGIRESGAFILLATNREGVIDNALLRDGRCDFKIKVKRPTKEAAETILTRSFAHVFAGEPVDQLAFAALEAFYDPNHIIAEAKSITANFEKREIKLGLARHFLLEDIVSGAMLVSIPQRATRLAFARDKKSGEPPKGVLVTDVIKAVNDLFLENKDLEHPYAQEEFMEKFAKDLEKENE